MTLRYRALALRSFFRFLRFEGFCGDELEAALPAVAHWRLATLPRVVGQALVDLRGGGGRVLVAEPET